MIITIVSEFAITETTKNQIKDIFEHTVCPPEALRAIIGFNGFKDNIIQLGLKGGYVDMVEVKDV